MILGGAKNAILNLGTSRMHFQEPLPYFIFPHCFVSHSLQDQQTTVILIAILWMRTVLLMSCLAGTWTSEPHRSTVFLPLVTKTIKTL